MILTVVCDVLGEENNGTTIAAMNLIRSMRQKGYTVRVVCPDESRQGQPGFFIVPTYNLRVFNGYVQKNGVTLAKPVQSILEAAIVGADVVHIIVPFALGRAALSLAKAQGIPVTAGFHCQAENITNHIFLMNANLANRLIYKVFYRSFYQYCDCIHYPTQFICDLFEKETKPTNHYVISNGVNRSFVRRDCPKPEELQDKFVILSTGRYSKEKSQQILLRAVALSKFKDKIQLILAGKGPRQAFLEQEAEKLGLLPPIFRFFSREALIDVINYADLDVHPAEIEIESIACLEAIACGKVPIIADSPRSAARNFSLTPENLFACNDPASLAKRIDGWLSDPQARAACSEKYLGYAQAFAFDRCMEQMEQMLLDAVEGKRHG